MVGNGGYSPAETLQLTDAVIFNLTSLSLTNISLFNFGDSGTTDTKSTAAAATAECKTFPGDAAWPDESTWDVLNLLTGEALIKTVPLASPCYDDWGNYDADECAFLNDQWTNSSLQYVLASRTDPGPRKALS